MQKRIKREGQKFGKLTLLAYVSVKKYLCKCECGKEKIIRLHSLLNGSTRSCGCIKKISRSNYDNDIKNKILNSINVNKNGCWVWLKSKHKQGYGHCAYKGNVMLAHRVSWIIFKGEIPENLLVLHKCDNPPCCNPEHLFLGSDKDNVLDSIYKKRFTRSKGIKHYFSKYNEDQILLCRKLAAAKKKYKEISKLTGISLKSISGIVNRKSWSHVK